MAACRRAWPWCVGVPVQHPGGLVAESAPRGQGRRRRCGRRCGQFFGGQARCQHRVRVPDASGVGGDETRQGLRRPAGRQGPRLQPGRAGHADPLSAATAGPARRRIHRLPPPGAGFPQARAVGAGARGRRTVPWMVLWTVRVQPLHPVAEMAAPRYCGGCTPFGPRGAAVAPRWHRYPQPFQMRGAAVAPRCHADRRPGNWFSSAARSSSSRSSRIRCMGRSQPCGRWAGRLILAAMTAGSQGRMVPSASRRSRAVRTVRSDRSV